MSELLVGTGLAILIVVVLWVLLRITVTLGPHCKCGHARSVHKGPNTECVGYRAAGRNAVGAKQWDPCPCPSYRPTSVGYWRRVWHGTEERQW